MSRYEIAAKDERRHLCIVGYDNPLQTYFAQVLELETFDAEELRDTKVEELQFDDEHIALWIGTDPFEISHISELQIRLAEYAEVPEGICLLLAQDRSQRSALTTLQQEMHALIKEWSTGEGPHHR